MCSTSSNVSSVRVTRIEEVLPFKILQPSRIFKKSHFFFIFLIFPIRKTLHNILAKYIIWRHNCNAFSHKMLHKLELQSILCSSLWYVNMLLYNITSYFFINLPYYCIKINSKMQLKLLIITKIKKKYIQIY